MALRKLTSSEAAQGYALDVLPSEDAQPFSAYHDPKTGKVFPRLPADPWSVTHYKRRGLRLGLPDSAAQSQPQAASEPEKDSQTLLREMSEEIARLKAQLEEPTPAEEKPPKSVQLRMF